MWSTGVREKPHANLLMNHHYTTYLLHAGCILDCLGLGLVHGSLDRSSHGPNR